MAVAKKHLKTPHHVKDLNLAPKGHGRIEWAGRSMPVLANIRERFAKQKPLRGLRVSACLHVTTETAHLMQTLHAGGADLTSISYNDSTGNRTVTGPLGVAETYSFTTLQGVAKVSSIARAASSPVASATRNFTYDANGYLATATDDAAIAPDAPR